MKTKIELKNEPSRIAQLAEVGAELLDGGVPSRDVDPCRGLLSCSPALLDRLARKARLGDSRTPLLTMLPAMIDTYRVSLTRRGKAVLFRRRRDRYLADCANWAATPDSVKEGAWRFKRMTTGQRYEVIRTCQRLEIDPPGPMKRGPAAEWLADHGANLNYRGKENENG